MIDFGVRRRSTGSCRKSGEVGVGFFLRSGCLVGLILGRVGVEDFGRRRQIRSVMMAKKIAYRGKVQGVGFRYSVRQIAEGFTVSGHAANLPDGRVEVFLQGDRDEVEAMEKEIGESHLASFIREVVGEEVNAIAGTKGFQIQ
jgi:acylphosphatase